MKWLILILLCACGKHDEPKQLDLRDSDGDQVLNYQESTLEKYVAFHDVLGPVKGTIKIYGEKLINISFTNQVGEDSGLKLAVTRNEMIEKDYFTEWSKLRLDSNDILNESKTLLKVELLTDSTSDSPDEVILKRAGSHILLGRWSQYMTLQLSTDDLNSLLTGKSHFLFRKKPKQTQYSDVDTTETIRTKTYKVLIYEGQKTKFLYVSKELPIQSLLKQLGIKEYKNLQENEIFFYEESDLVSWFVREVEGKYFIVKSSGKELKEFFLTNFTKKNIHLKRENGFPSNEVKFQNIGSSRIYFKMRNVVQKQNSFGERIEKRRHGSHEDKWECLHYLRFITQENIHPKLINEILPEIQLSGNVGIMLEQIDEKGQFTLGEIENALPDATLRLSPLPASTFIVTGEYQNSCGANANRGRDASFNTNSEAYLGLDIETYVEKI